MTSFSEEIILIIVDKGLIVILVVVLGFLLNRALERYKRDQILYVDAARRRIEALVSVFLLASQYESKMDELQDALKSGESPDYKKAFMMKQNSLRTISRRRHVNTDFCLEKDITNSHFNMQIYK